MSPSRTMAKRGFDEVEAAFSAVEVKLEPPSPKRVCLNGALLVPKRESLSPRSSAHRPEAIQTPLATSRVSSRPTPPVWKTLSKQPRKLTFELSSPDPPEKKRKRYHSRRATAHRIHGRGKEYLRVPTDRFRVPIDLRTSITAALTQSTFEFPATGKEYKMPSTGRRGTSRKNRS